MRVLHVITALNVGGAENMLLKLLQASALSRVHQQVITMLPGGELRQACSASGAQVDEASFLGGLPLVSGVGQLATFARRAKPDLVQGWLYHGNLGALLARAVQPGRVPLVWGVRQSLASLQGENRWARLAIHANRWLSGRADAIVFNARTSIDQHRCFGFSSSQVHHVPNGFDGQRFRPDPALRRQRRGAWGFGEDAVVFGMLARLHPAKGHVDFLHAARALWEQRPAARFVIAGPDHDGQAARLRATVDSLGLRGLVLLRPGHHDAASWLPGLDVFVSASTSIEAFSNALGEAQCCGLPCVATQVGDSPWILGEHGRLVAPAQPGELAEAMRSLMDESVDSRQTLGLLGRERMLREFGLDAIAARFGTLWRELIEGPSRGRFGH